LGNRGSLRSHRGHLRKPTKIEGLLEIEEVDENEVNCKIEDEDKIEEEVIGKRGARFARTGALCGTV
jgi:hypothetical protein